MELREIITPTSNAYVVNLPDEMIGKKVELIVHEVETPAKLPDPAESAHR